MRPSKLTISAFGPYAQRQVIDFSQLKDRSFFLIHGPTGSGKTTILDAICFALYGDTSGVERNGKQMCSDHSDFSVPTEVILDFTIGNQSYRVKRNPEQERPKKRGEGTVTMRSDATLWQRTGLCNDEEEGIVLESGWSKVTDKIENILGFKSEQFRQVVLLPQGDFRKLLTANSVERQDILETLFKTEFFRRIEEVLNQNSKDLRKQFEDISKEKSWVLQEAKVKSLEDLVNNLNENNANLITTRAKYIELRDLEKKSQERVNEGQDVINKLNEKEKAKLEIEKLELQGAVIENKRKELLEAQQASRLSDGELVLNTRRKEEEEAVNAYIQIQSIYKSAEEVNKVALSELENEKAKEVKREEANREVMRLEDMTDKVNVLVEDNAKVQKLSNEVKAITLEKDQIKKASNQVVQDIENKKIYIDDLATEAAKVSNYELIVQEFKRIYDKRQELEKLKFEESKINKDYQQSLQKLQQEEEKYSQHRTELANLQERWAKGQATILAGNLIKGIPCPVCGGVDHPQPAQSDIDTPTEREVKLLQEVVDKLEGVREKVRIETNEILSIKATIESKVQLLEEELAEKVKIDIKVLQANMNESNIRLDNAKKAQQDLQKQQQQLEVLREKEKHFKIQLEEIEANLMKITIALENAKTIVTEKEKTVPIELRNFADLQRAQKIAQERFMQLKKAWEQAQKKAEEASQKLVQAHTSLDAAESNVKLAKLRLEEEQKIFLKRIKEAGFNSLQNYELAKRSLSIIQNMEIQIKEYDENILAAQKYLAKISEETLNIEKPNLEILKKELEEIVNIREQVQEQGVKLKTQIEREQVWIDKITHFDAKLQKVEKQYAALGRLSEVANGKNNFGLTFQRFVLGALLDDVTTAATERLKLMSRGRYHLQRTLNRTRSNAAAGLELEVLDNYTGVARAVTTLSGGETFLASLSLALGLADVVQAYAGGIHLDTIFIDEGFGTLDPESLDFAIKALIDLQKGGRLVGIISHVPELKERIDARLEVIPTTKGSIASFKFA